MKLKTFTNTKCFNRRLLGILLIVFLLLGWGLTPSKSLLNKDQALSKAEDLVDEYEELYEYSDIDKLIKLVYIPFYYQGEEITSFHDLKSALERKQVYVPIFDNKVYFERESEFPDPDIILSGTLNDLKKHGYDLDVDAYYLDLEDHDIAVIKNKNIYFLRRYKHSVVITGVKKLLI
jgi:hypothetical protein